MGCFQSLCRARRKISCCNVRMKILFLEIDTESHWGLASTGPAYIASFIRQRGHDASLLRVPPQAETNEIIDRITAASPDLIGFSLTTRQWLRARSLASQIRQALSTPVIAGGLHATFAASSVLESGAFDFVCLGEGEQAVCDLLDALKNGPDFFALQIPNIWMKGQKRPALRPALSAEHIPLMARGMLDETSGIVHVSTMRGCPFSCSFCGAAAIAHLYPGTSYMRRRTVENVVKELELASETMPINYVIFLDDTFTLDRNWLARFCDIYPIRINRGFSINARAETVDGQMIEMLAKAGCRHIVYGVESGSRRVREEILKRPGDDGIYLNAFRRTKEAGIMATANYMIGLPGETTDDIEQTLAFNELLAPDHFACFVFYPFPGTPLFDTCLKNQYLPAGYAEMPVSEGQSILKLPDLPAHKIEKYYRRFVGN